MHTRHTAGIWGEEQLKFCAAPLPFITCWIYENVWKQLKSDRCANFHLDMFGCSWDSLSGKWHSQGFTAVLWASFSSLDQYTQLQAQVSPCWLYTHMLNCFSSYKHVVTSTSPNVTLGGVHHVLGEPLSCWPIEMNVIALGWFRRHKFYYRAFSCLRDIN